MPAPATSDDFLQLARQSALLEEKDLDTYLQTRGESLPGSPQALAAAMVRDGLLTGFQAGQFLKGKWRGFIIAGKYKLLEHLGSGGMASVFLCEHVSMHRRVAIKILPPAQAKDPGAVERFYREARAVATLDHPNIVRAHDIDHDGPRHFLVMEYVDGASLQDIVRKHGPLSVERAVHYVRQAAVGLQYAHEVAGLIHRDIKPGNILVDRSGTVKLLDLGLARFFHDEGDEITKKFDENCVLGTADYCAPEQAMNSHDVDIRVDIYSLGATFYYCLTGQTPFGQGTTAQKIIWHQMREPAPVRELRPEVPEGVAAVLAKMMAKEPDARYQEPAEVVEALAPWDADDLPPPPEDEMPKLCARSQGPGSNDPSTVRRQKAATTMSGRIKAAGPRSGVSSAAVASRSGIRAAASNSKLPRLEKPLTKNVPLLVGAGAGALLLVVLLAFGAWWLLTDHNKKNVVAVAPPADTGRAPEPIKVAVAPTETAKAAPAPVAAEVAITTTADGRHVRTPRYEAVVADDGSMTSLKVGGVEFFKSGLKFGNQEARGAYVFSEGGQGVLRLPQVEQSANVITCRGDRAELRQVFNASSIAWTVTNRADDEERFYIVFDKNVKAVTNGQGQWQEVPARIPGNAPANFQVAHDWPTTSWFAGRSRLTLVGGTRIWGQWPTPQDNYQVWQLTLPPHQSRDVVASVGEATTQELEAAAAVATPPPSPEGVTVTEDPAGRRVRTPKYEALVEKDGCVTSLKVGGTELLWPGLSFSRGSYFYQKKVVPMPQVEQPAANVITAKGTGCSARYEFGADRMTWDLTNDTNEPMMFYLVFRPVVSDVSNGEETAHTPVRKEWATTTWHFGKGRLKIAGGTRIWGPWPQPTDTSQVWDATLAPHETRRVTMQVLAAPEGAAAGMSLQSPRDYQVFQRQAPQKGAVVVRGTSPAACDAVEARLSGPSPGGPLPDRWQPLGLATGGQSFYATLPTPPGGWYKLEVRALREKKVIAEGVVGHVGVGEVFVIAGQSNSTNSGEERQRTETGLVSAFDGEGWRVADDPQPGTQDHSGGGSPWPAFGDALVAKFKVPIGIASTGRGGTSVNEWRPDGELFAGLTKRMSALGRHGFRAVLWHQGENDAGMAGDDYARRLTEIIQASRKAEGWDVPWFVAQVSYRNPSAPKADSLRAGQKKLWDTQVALEGPDTDALGGDNRDQGGQGIHFSAKGLRAHGKLWADKVGAYLDKVLAQ